MVRKADDEAGEEVEDVGSDEDSMDGSEVLDHVGAVEVVALDQAPVGDGGAADVDLFFLVGEVDDQTDVVGDGD